MGTPSSKLAKYRSMRDFDTTAEPSGDAPVSTGHSFVIQKHAARRLHYDFRLELDGVLLSWSVPKGPSLKPADRRLAVRTEDHPLDYAGFEGIIPKGQYGGGAVAVWDRGTWQPHGDPKQALAKGRLTFDLAGEKLHGRWHLIKTAKAGNKTEEWLLFKGRDGAANDEEDGDIVATRPESVLSGHTIEQIAAQPERVWQSNRTAEPTVVEKRTARITHHKPAENHNELASLVNQLPLGFKLTNLDKVLYPDQGITKGQLIAYLAVVSEWMLPHVARRPLTLVRCPEGTAGKAHKGKPCFFQKQLLPGSPKSIMPVSIAEHDGEVASYMQIADMPGLVALAQLGTLEIHTWGCHTDNIERPDLMVIDIDPDVGLAWERVALAAFELRKRLRAIGLDSFVKTTGGKGLHVVVPVMPELGWDDFKAVSKELVEAMEHDEPKLYTTNMAKVQRRGKIFLDYLRNGRNATFIVPYSPRARSGAPVAVPITWEELAQGIDPAAFTTLTVPRRLASLDADPWHEMRALQQSIVRRRSKATTRHR